jgi:hypothetical protein
MGLLSQGTRNAGYPQTADDSPRGIFRASQQYSALNLLPVTPEQPTYLHSLGVYKAPASKELSGFSPRHWVALDGGIAYSPAVRYFILEPDHRSPHVASQVDLLFPIRPHPGRAASLNRLAHGDQLVVSFAHSDRGRYSLIGGFVIE